METTINSVALTGLTALSTESNSLPPSTIAAKEAKEDSTESQNTTVQASLSLVNGRYVGSDLTDAEKLDEKIRHATILLKELPSQTAETVTAFDTIMSQIASKNPDIVTKDWDFSIDENNEITIINNGDLTEEEQIWLQEELDHPYLVVEVMEMRDLMIKAIKTERGQDGYSTQVGRYDLTTENYSEIIHMREYLTDNNGKLGITELVSQLSQRAEDKYSNITYEYIG